MPSITLNGAPRAHAAATVAELLAAEGLEPAPAGIAVALNEAVVPRAAWGQTRLGDGDQVELVRLLSGG